MSDKYEAMVKLVDGMTAPARTMTASLREVVSGERSAASGARSMGNAISSAAARASRDAHSMARAVNHASGAAERGARSLWAWNKSQGESLQKWQDFSDSLRGTPLGMADASARPSHPNQGDREAWCSPHHVQQQNGSDAISVGNAVRRARWH